MIHRHGESGAALLSVLLIVSTLSIAALIATSTIARQTELQKFASRRSAASWAARSAESVVLASAVDLVQASRLPAGTSSEDRVQSAAIPMAGGQIIIHLRELGPCLNLNALADPDAASQTRHIAELNVLLDDIGVSDSDALRLIDALADWVDADAIKRPNGNEDGDYLAKADGFRAANQPLKSLAELAAIPGFSPELRAAIDTFACVTPSTKSMALNVNALSQESIPALRAFTLGQLSPTEARRFIDSRPSAGWANTSDVIEEILKSPVLKSAFEGVPLAVTATYFKADGQVLLDEASWHFRFMLAVENGQAPKVIWRSFGDAE